MANKNQNQVTKYRTKGNTATLNGPIFNTGCITIIVGASQIPITVHEKRLQEGTWLRNQATANPDNRIWILDSDPNVVNVYIHWLYKHTLPHEIKPYPVALPSYPFLGQLYGFGKGINDKVFQDRVIKALLWKLWQRDVDGNLELPTMADIKAIYEAISGYCEDFPARKLMVDLQVSCGRKGSHWIWDKSAREENHPEFLADVAYAYMLCRERKKNFDLWNDMRAGNTGRYFHYSKR